MAAVPWAEVARGAYLSQVSAPSANVLAVQLSVSDSRVEVARSAPEPASSAADILSVSAYTAILCISSEVGMLMRSVRFVRNCNTALLPDLLSASVCTDNSG